MNTVREDGPKAATELVQELMRVFKVRRLYGEGHPQRTEVETTAAEHIGGLLDRAGPVELRVDGEALHGEDDEVVYESTGPESLPPLLFREGVRQIAFLPGLEADELGGFLDAVASAALQPAGADFDLLARLWEQRFVHIRYSFVEALADEEWTPPATESEVEPDTPSSELIQRALEEEPTVALEIPKALSAGESTLYFLDDEDMATLQAELESEKRRALFTEVLTLVRELLFDPVVDDLEPALALIDELHGAYLKDGLYRGVIEIHEVFRPYLQSPRAPLGVQQRFVALCRAAVEREAFGRLAARVHSGLVPVTDAVDYLRVLGTGQLEQVLECGSGELKRLCQEPLLAEAFREMARLDPEGLSRAIGSDDADVVMAGCFLAGLASDGRQLEALGTALASDSAEVRREAMLALKGFGTGPALEHVSRAVEDPDPAVRLYALRHLVGRRYEPALPRVEERLAQDDPDRSLTELRLLYEAYGALGGETVVDDLVSRYRRRGGLFRRRDPEETACILIALGATTSDEAREVVERALEDRNPLVARIAQQVLDAWGGTLTTGT